MLQSLKKNEPSKSLSSSSWSALVARNYPFFSPSQPLLPLPPPYNFHNDLITATVPCRVLPSWLKFPFVNVSCSCISSWASRAAVKCSKLDYHHHGGGVEGIRGVTSRFKIHYLTFILFHLVSLRVVRPSASLANLRPTDSCTRQSRHPPTNLLLHVILST